MRIKPRPMKKYTPRRRRSSKILQKQQLKDFEQLLEMDLNTFLILNDEGTSKQIEQARTKMRSDLRKYGSDMEAIGRDIGEGFPERIREYLKSLSHIVQNSTAKIDPALLNQHEKKALLLKKSAA
ncbi:MAG: hypothetical protein P0S96_03890 [Simkaniaceae bacterium]|nr:hypothetical protein [Candidatus Sacchlamyda saccharinae]